MIISFELKPEKIRFSLNLERDKQKDYDYSESLRYFVFVYGYPYLLKKDSYEWINSEQITTLFENNGLKFVKKIDGVFSIFIFDKKINKIYVISDAYGIYSLFYHQYGNTYWIFDNIEEMLPSLKRLELNNKTIYESLITGYGFRFGLETHIKGIFSFDRGSIYTISYDKDFEKDRYWTGRESLDLKKETFYKHLKKHFLRSMELDGKKFMTMTGGFDTSTVLSSILHKDFKITSFGTKNSNDITSARKIAKKYNKDFYPYILDERFVKKFIEVAEKYYGMFNGLTPHIQYIQFLLMAHREKSNSDILYLGLLGDEIWRLCGMNVNFIRRFHKKEIYDACKDYSETDLIRSYHNKDSDLDFLIDSYGTNFGSNIVKMCGKHMKVFLSLINKDILEKIASERISKEDRVSGSLQMDFVKQTNKDVYKILKRNKRVNPIKILVNRIYRKIFHKNLFTNYPNKPHTYDVWLRKFYSDYVRKVFIENYEKLNLKDLFHKEKLQTIIRKYLKGDDSYFTFVISFLSIEIWLKNILKKYITMVDI
jgi:hypothetical protein